MQMLAGKLSYIMLNSFILGFTLTFGSAFESTNSMTNNIIPTLQKIM